MFRVIRVMGVFWVLGLSRCGLFSLLLLLAGFGQLAVPVSWGPGATSRVVVGAGVGWRVSSVCFFVVHCLKLKLFLSLGGLGELSLGTWAAGGLFLGGGAAMRAEVWVLS